MEGALKACLKRKAAAEPLSDGEQSAVAATASAELEVKHQEQQRRQGKVDGEDPPKARMSQAWIESVLTAENKPLPFTERHLENPVLADAFRSHEEYRAWFAEYQAWVRSEYEAKGFVERPDGYDETCARLQAIHTAAFYATDDGEVDPKSA